MSGAAQVTLAVKVVPGSSRSRLAGRYGDGVKVQVSAAPEKGKANAAVVEVLSAWLEISASHIELVAGHANPRKQFRITGLSPGQLQAKMQALS